MHIYFTQLIKTTLRRIKTNIQISLLHFSQALSADNNPSCLRDCRDVQDLGFTQSGVYTINPDTHDGYNVYCDMDTDGGGWLVSKAMSKERLSWKSIADNEWSLTRVDRVAAPI